MTRLSATAAVRHDADVLVLSTGDVRIRRYPDAVIAPRYADQAYRDPAGDDELRHLIANRSGASIGADQVVVTPGARQAVVAALKAVLGQRPEVLLPSPYWGSYPPLIELAGGRTVVVPGPVGDAAPDVAALQAAWTPHTGAVIINSPRNPDGAVASAESLRALVRWAADRDLTVLFDQVYRGVALSADPAASIVDLYPEIPSHCLIIDGLSKSHALAGLRIGWALAPAAVAARIGAVASHFVGGTSSTAQDVATAVLRADDGRDRRPDPDLVGNLDLALDALAGTSGVSCTRPAGGIFLFPDLRSWLTTAPAQARDGVVPWLRERHRVAVVDGAAFGADGHVRLSFAIPADQLAIGMHRLRAALNGQRPYTKDR
jgi:aspartate aminotransferase